MTFTYTRKELITINANRPKGPNKLLLHENVHLLIKDLNLQGQRRGCRAGKRKCARNSNVTVHQPSGASSKPDVTNEGIKVGVINTRSIRNKVIDFQEMILDNSLDLIAVTETWLTDEDYITPGEMCPLKYDIIHTPRQAGKGGGVALVHNEHLHITQCNTRDNFHSFELVEATLVSNSETFRIIVIYRPPPSQSNNLKISQFKEEFPTLLESLVIQNEQLLIMGDFNIHVEDTNDSLASFLQDTLTSFGIKQHVGCATHNKSHTLDLVMTRSEEHITEVHVTDPQLSDHYLVSFRLHTELVKYRKKKVQYRKLKAINLDSFERDLKNSDLFHCNSEDVDILTNLYDTTLKDLLNKHAPEITKLVSDRQTVPWYSNSIGDLRRKRRRLERRWKLHKTPSNLIAWKGAKNDVTEAIKRAKTLFYTKSIDECKGDQKKLFGILNSLLQKKKITFLPSGDKSSLPEIFNDFFIQKIDKILEGLHAEQTGADPHEFDVPATSRLETLCSTNEEEIQKLILGCPNKQCSLDPVPTAIVKQCSKTFAPIFTKIINASLHSGIVPSSFKKSIVTPLLKKNSLNPEILKNYRPVSNLSFASKLLERVVAHRLNNYKDSNCLREKFQSAYRRNHSTETATLKIMNDLLMAADRGECSILVLLDLSAAFDTVNHQILLERLQNQFGIVGKAHKWIKSYLHNRCQKVMVEHFVSNEVRLTLNVPQGSILGPSEYSDFTEPVGRVIRSKSVSPHFYADDSQLYVHCNPKDQNSVQSAIHKIEDCCKEIKSWMTTNYLKLNDDKTEVLMVGTKSQLHKSNIHTILIGNTNIEVKDCVKNIGVYIDSELTMKQHVNQITSTAWFHLRNLFKIRKFLTKSACVTLVHAFVTSRLDLYNCLLYNCPSGLKNKLQRVLNCAAKLIFHKRKFDSVTPLLKKLHWLPIQQRIEFKILLITFKCINGQGPEYLSELLTPYSKRQHLNSGITYQFISVPVHQSAHSRNN